MGLGSDPRKNCFLVVIWIQILGTDQFSSLDQLLVKWTCFPEIWKNHFEEKSGISWWKKFQAVLSHLLNFRLNAIFFPAHVLLSLEKVCKICWTLCTFGISQAPLVFKILSSVLHRIQRTLDTDQSLGFNNAESCQYPSVSFYSWGNKTQIWNKNRLGADLML